MKPDERKLLDELQRQYKRGARPPVWEVISEIGMNEKRAAYICEKWAGKGWYDYGVNVLFGWLKDEGLKA